MGLNSGYDAIRSHILDTDPLPTVNRAHYIIQQQEKQTKLRENMYMQIKLEVEAHTVYKQSPRPTAVNKKDNRKTISDTYCQHSKV